MRFCDFASPPDPQRTTKTARNQKMYELIICAKISIFLSKMAQEMIDYAQEMSQEVPGNVSRSSGVIIGI